MRTRVTLVDMLLAAAAGRGLPDLGAGRVASAGLSQRQRSTRNGSGEAARRRRQIERGQLTVSNGLLLPPQS